MPLPDFSTLQPVGGGSLPDFGSLKPVETQNQPSAASSLQFSSSQTLSTPEALAHQNLQGNQKFFNDMASKAGVTPDEYQQKVFQEAQANQDAALDSSNPRNAKTPVGAFGVELLKQAHDFASDPSKSALDSILPSKEISKEDSAPVAVGKEAYNLLVTIPKFATSPIGVVTGGAGKVVKPGIMASAWTADIVKNLGHTILRDYQNWDKMSNGEKAAAVTEVAGTAGLAGLTGAHAAEDLSGVRSPGVRSFESTPTRNAKDLAFALNQTTPKFPVASPVPAAPVVGQPNQPGVHSDLSQQPAPVPPIPKAEAVNTGRTGLPPQLVDDAAIKSVTPKILSLEKQLGHAPTIAEVIDNILPDKKGRKYPNGRSVDDVVSIWLGEIYPQRKQTAADGLTSSDDTGNLGNAKAFKSNQLQTGAQTIAGNNPENEGRVGEAKTSQSELQASHQWLKAIQGNDPEAIRDAQEKLLGQKMEIGGIHGGANAGGEQIRTPNGHGEISGQETSEQRIGSPQKREQIGQQAGELASDVPVGTQPSSQSEIIHKPAPRKNAFKNPSTARTVVEAVQKLSDVQDKKRATYGARTLQQMLSSSALSAGEKSEIIKQIKEAASSQASQEKVKPGMVRLYNGASDASGTSYWSTKKERAEDFAGRGGYVHTVDVPISAFKAGELAAKKMASYTKGDSIVPKQHTAKMTRVDYEPKATDITDADKPIDPKNAADLVKMSPEDAAAWFKTVKGTTVGEAESRSKAARAKLTDGMTDQQVLDAANQVDAQNEEFKQNPTAENLTKLGANSHKGQFLREALHDRGYSREYESGKTLEEQIDAKTSGGGTTGIAHRVSEARGVAAERGQGASPATQVEHGRQLLAGGADPEKILSDFQADPRKATSSDGFSILRAQQEQLAKAADRAVDEHGASSPQAAAAAKADSDWIEKIKPYQTEWAKQGTAQQGETDLDTGSFTALRRSFESEAKKPMTPKQSRDLQKIAGENKKASDEVDAAIKAVTESVDKSPVSERIKSITQKVYDALDEQAKAALQRLNARRAKVGSNLAPQDLADYAILGAAQIAKGIIKFPEWSKSMLDQFGDVLKSDDLEKIYDVAKQKHLNVVRDNFGEFKSGKPFTPDQVKTLWKYAKDNYITGGEVNFAKIRNSLSNDFGLSKPDVARALTQNSATRNLLDNAYTKQYRARQLRQYAKTWIKREATPSLVRKVKAIPRGLFNLAVFGHGTTWIGTHAGQNLYDPTQWGSLGRNYAKMWKVAYSPIEYEKEAQDLVARPNWETARRAGVNNDPYTRQGDYDTPELTKWAKTIGIGHRGALGLMTLRQDYFDTVWDNLPATDKNREMAKSIADLTNHATGTTRMKMVENPWTNLLLFAPRLVASRFQWDVADPARAALIKGFGLLGKKPTAQEAMFANHVIKKRAIFVATLLSALGLNQIVLNATGSKQKINLNRPHESDWLRFKGFGMEVEPFSAGVAVARLMAQEYSDFFVNHKHRGGLPFNPAEQAGTDALRYGRAELSPVASHSLDLAAQSDYSGRPLPAIPGRNPPPDEPAYLKREGVKPYTWAQYAFTAAPIPAEGAIQEAFQTQGMNESAAKKYTKLILSAAAMASTGVLVKEDPKAKQ